MLDSILKTTLKKSYHLFSQFRQNHGNTHDNHISDQKLAKIILNTDIGIDHKRIGTGNIGFELQFLELFRS